MRMLRRVSVVGGPVRKNCAHLFYLANFSLRFMKSEGFHNVHIILRILFQLEASFVRSLRNVLFLLFLKYRILYRIYHLIF
jgi:hypothetical protein